MKVLKDCWVTGMSDLDIRDKALTKFKLDNSKAYLHLEPCKTLKDHEK